MTVKTLNLNAKPQIVLVDRDNDRAPDDHICAVAIELGSGSTRAARDKSSDDISVKLDDPSFSKPTYASLVYADDIGNPFGLIWSRPNGN